MFKKNYFPQAVFCKTLSANNIYGFFKRNYKGIVFANFAVISSVAVARAFNSVLLGRILSKDDFGVYSFLFTSIVPLVSIILILGQQNSVIRYFSKQDFCEFQWKKYFKNVSVVFFLLTLVTILSISLFYRFPFIFFFYLVLSIFSSISLIFIACFFRSREKYLTSQLLMGLSPLIFIFFIGLLVLTDSLNLSNATLFKTITYVAPFIIVCSFFLLKNKEGAKSVTNRIYFDGLLLWGFGATQLALNRFDSFFIVKYIDYQAVADYSIIFLFVSLYDFASNAIWSVYSRRFSSEYKPELKRFLLRIGVVAFTISFFYLILGKPLLHILFRGKYDNSFYLLLPCCIIGCLKLNHVYTACYFLGKAQSNTLKRVLQFNVIGVILKIIFLILGIIFFGLLGAVLSGIVAWIYRNIVGYIFVFKDMKAKANYIINPR